MQVTSLYICPWSLEDPLCQSQTLPYLRGLSAAHGYKFALITFENPVFALDSPEKEKRQKQLEDIGIFWYPVSYHQGLSLTAKALNNYHGTIAGLKIWRRHHPRIIHSRSSLSTAIAVILTKLYRCNFLYDADSVLSEEYVDINHWTRQSAGFKFLSKAESLARKTAKQIIVLTDTLRQDFIKSYGVKNPIEVIPCCVDLDKFTLNPENRELKRSELNLSDEKLFIYVGKIGSWYLVEEMFDFFKQAKEALPSAKLLVISQDTPDAFDKIAADRDIPKDSYFVKKADHREVAQWLAAADAGLAFVKSLKSKRGSSPIKVAEYLASGLPVVMTDGIGDCSTIINENKVGAIIENTNSENYRQALDNLFEIWNEKTSAVAERCRTTAEKSYSLEKVGIARYHNIYQKLL